MAEEKKKDLFQFKFKTFDANALTPADKAFLKENATAEQLGRFAEAAGVSAKSAPAANAGGKSSGKS
ncbi:MAG: hypothetical protein ACRBFS_22840 [Aureispira sp.]